MNTSRLTALGAALVAVAALPLLSRAAVPLVDGVGRPAQIRCGSTPAGAPVYAAHADKIIFQISGALQAANPADQDALDRVPRNTGLDIKVLDNPKSVADLKGKVLTFLGALDTPNARAGVNILEVAYAMVCPTTAAAAGGA